MFQAAGLPFYLMMGLGCIMAFSSVLVWGVENNEKSCAARVWMWTLCFHMFVDPLLASSWRISRIFSQRLQTVKLTNRTVGLVCLAIVTPQLIINVLWQIIAPLEPSIVTESGQELRPAHTSFTTCSAGDNGVIFAGATLAYSGLCLVAACYLAYKVRMQLAAMRMRMRVGGPVDVCSHSVSFFSCLVAAAFPLCPCRFAKPTACSTTLVRSRCRCTSSR